MGVRHYNVGMLLLCKDAVRKHSFPSSPANGNGRYAEHVQVNCLCVCPDLFVFFFVFVSSFFSFFGFISVPLSFPKELLYIYPPL